MQTLPPFLLWSWMLVNATLAAAGDALPTATRPAASQPIGSQPVFQILDVDLGDRAWGLNCMKVRVRHTNNEPRTLFVHIGGRPPSGSGASGFGMGDRHKVLPGEQVVEHWYWLPPCHGTIQAKVRFIVPTTDKPSDETPFLSKVYAISFSLPNDRCNNLMIADKIEGLRKFYPADMRRIEPFKYRKTEHFVFYYSPDTPAAADIATLAKDHEAALAGACEFFGVRPSETIVVFFYPDQLTKRMCTGHQGDGLASGHMIAQVYNEKTHLDPYHEITHVVADQVGSPPAMFNEGLATWMAKDHIWEGKPVNITAAELLKAGRLVPLESLLTRTEIGARNDDGEVAYPQSASFAGYLVRTYGKAKFLQAYNALRNSDDPVTLDQNQARIESIFGESLKAMEAAWKKSLQ